MLGLPADVVRALADAGYLAAVVAARWRAPLRPRRPQGVPGRVDDAGGDPTSRCGTLAGDDDLDVDAMLALIGARVGDMAERSLDLLNVACVPGTLSFTDDVRRRQLPGRGRASASRRSSRCAPTGRAATSRSRPTSPRSAPTPRTTACRCPAVLVAAARRRATSSSRRPSRSPRSGVGAGGWRSPSSSSACIPAIDRLSDAVARGYWEAVLEIEAEGDRPLPHGRSTRRRRRRLRRSTPTASSTTPTPPLLGSSVDRPRPRRPTGHRGARVGVAGTADAVIALERATTSGASRSASSSGSATASSSAGTVVVAAIPVEGSAPCDGPATHGLRVRCEMGAQPLSRPGGSPRRRCARRSPGTRRRRRPSPRATGRAVVAAEGDGGLERDAGRAAGRPPRAASASPPPSPNSG